jgi:type I restriction enzyme S subunit
MIYKRCPHRPGRPQEACDHPWYASFQFQGQPRARVALAKWTGEPIQTKRQALAAFDDLKAAVRAGRFNRRGRLVAQLSGAVPTLQQLAREHFDKVTSHTVGERPGPYWSRLKPALMAFAETPIDQITTAAIDDWKLALQRPRTIHGEHRQPTTATVNRAIAELRRLLNWAVRRDLLIASPFLKGGLAVVRLDHEDNHRDRRLTEAEEAQLLQHSSALLRALIIIALDTGARRGEMLAIRVGDVDLVRGEITLRGSTTKSGKTRTVPVGTARLRAALEWLQTDSAGQIRPCSQPLVCNSSGQPIMTFRRAWEDAVLRAHDYDPQRETRRPNAGTLAPPARRSLKDTDLHWHDLRHEFASRLVEGGVTITEVAALLGHASVVTTQRYLSHTLARLKSSAQTLEKGGNFDPGDHGGPGRRVVECGYLYAFCQSEDYWHQVRSAVRGAAQGGVNSTTLSSLVLALPDLSEQSRIAAELEQADRLLRLTRRYALELTDTILPAAFLELFGDPQANPKGWDSCTIDDVVLSSQYGTSAKSNSAKQGYPILGMGNITNSGSIDLSTLAYVDLPKNEFANLALRRGDIIFNRTNSTELVGKTAFWNLDIDAVLASYLVRLWLKPEVLPQFFTALLNTRYFKNLFRDRCKKAVGQSNISPTLLKEFPAYIPPLPLQQKFACLVERVERLRAVQREALRQAEHLFATLLHRAFNAKGA